MSRDNGDIDAFSPIPPHPQVGERHTKSDLNRSFTATESTTLLAGERMDHNDQGEMPVNLLFKLPAELRLRIYELALIESFPLFLWQGMYSTVQQPGLTRVDRTIRSEALPIFYGENEFTVGFGCLLEIENAIRWAKTIGKANWDCVKQVLALEPEYDGFIECCLRMRGQDKKLLQSPAAMVVIYGMVYRQFDKAYLLDDEDEKT